MMTYNPTRRLVLRPLSVILSYRGKRDAKRISTLADKIRTLLHRSLLPERFTSRLAGVEIVLTDGAYETLPHKITYAPNDAGDFAVIKMRRPVPQEGDTATYDEGVIAFVIALFEDALKAVASDIRDQELFPSARHLTRLEELRPFLLSLAGLSIYDAKCRVREAVCGISKPSDALTEERMESLSRKANCTYLQGVRVIHDFARPELFPYTAISEELYTSVLESLPITVPGYSEVVVKFAATLYDASNEGAVEPWARIAPSIFVLDEFHRVPVSDRLPRFLVAVGEAMSALARRDGLDSAAVEDLKNRVAGMPIRPQLERVAAGFIPRELIESGTDEAILSALEDPKIARKWRNSLLMMPRFRVKKVA